MADITEQDAAVAAAKQAKKDAAAEHHAARIKAGHEHNAAQANKHWVGQREVKLMRPATEEDFGFVDDDACSVIEFVDTGVQRVILDRDIHPIPTGVA